jgi:hypothetical protein
VTQCAGAKRWSTELTMRKLEMPTEDGPMDTDEPKLSKSEEAILRALAGSEQVYPTLDWVALQHLRQRGLVEVTPSGPKITDKGRRAMSSP